MELHDAQWSLLLFVRKSKNLYNLHSIGTYNFLIAKQVATKVNSKFLGIENKESPIDVLKSPQLSNSVDCGIYTVLLFTDVFFKSFFRGSFLAFQCQK